MSCAKLMPGPPPQPEPSGKSLEEETCRSEGGFTLIELMVVLLILAILLAIAIPTFLGVTKSANDRAAQSNLNTALLNAKAQYQKNSQAYPVSATLVTALTSAEPSLTFQTIASANQNQISVGTTGDGSALVLAAYSVQTKNCWVVVDMPTKPDLTTAPIGPFAATQAPAVATFPATVTGTGTVVTFPTTPLGPTYAEIKTTGTGTESSGDCIATAALKVDTNTTYAWSNTAYPSI
jgi:type IV pilus assembly protein PilA